MKSRCLTLILILGILCGIVALAITVYPLVVNYVFSKNKSTVLTEYSNTVEQLEDNRIYEMLGEARAYNETLTPGAISIESLFTQEGQQYATANDYDILNVGTSGIMGYVEIPEISIYLPIYHGTESDVLDVGIGHFIGSSLPVDGESTHTILTGHSGMARERTFSDLDQLKAGDVFYLHVLNEILAYEVDQIKIVLSDNSDYLGIERGKDYCTLVTCTPFGVNIHRLLVRGHRVEYTESTDETVQEFENSAEPVVSTWQRQYIKGLVIGLSMLVAFMIFARITFFRKRGNMKHAQHRAPREGGVKNTLIALFLLVFLGGLCYALYPVATGVTHEIESRKVVDDFLHTIPANLPSNTASQDFDNHSSIEPTETPYPELLSAMQSYNEAIYAEGQSGLVDA